jgi:hypothetical protein
MDDMRILVWMGACALVALLALTVIVAHVVRGRSLRERSQATCPYCHGRRMLTCDGGKVRVSYLPKSGTWKVSSEALGFIGAFQFRLCPQCGRDLARRKGR